MPSLDIGDIVSALKLGRPSSYLGMVPCMLLVLGLACFEEHTTTTAYPWTERLCRSPIVSHFSMLRQPRPFHSSSFRTVDRQPCCSPREMKSHHRRRDRDSLLISINRLSCAHTKRGQAHCDYLVVICRKMGRCAGEQAFARDPPVWDQSIDLNRVRPCHAELVLAWRGFDVPLAFVLSLLGALGPKDVCAGGTFHILLRVEAVRQRLRKPYSQSSSRASSCVLIQRQ